MPEAQGGPGRENPQGRTLLLSQKAPLYLQKQKISTWSSPLSFIFSNESVEIWQRYEQLFLSTLQTGDDKLSHQCLERLISRFGAENDRVMGFKGLYQEAVAQNADALDSVLLEYKSILSQDPSNLPIWKRRVALLASLGRPVEAIGVLVELLENFPTDAEAWAELSDLYFSQGAYSQAVFCLEEVLLATPNAWNIHARLGEILYLSSFASSNAGDSANEKSLTEAIRRFCRSIELCEGYLRGYYGLKVATGRYLDSSRKNEKAQAVVSTDGENTLISVSTVRDLNEKATSTLSAIANGEGDIDVTRYDESEITSARKLLVQGSLKE